MSDDPRGVCVVYVGADGGVTYAAHPAGTALPSVSATPADLPSPAEDDTDYPERRGPEFFAAQRQERRRWARVVTSPGFAGAGAVLAARMLTDTNASASEILAVAGAACDPNGRWSRVFSSEQGG